MDTKNVITAISLSALVIILYSLFFAPPPPDISDKKNILENVKKNSDVSSPSIDKEVDNNNLSRNDALDLNERIKIENENIFGSISLSNGGVIDDYTFKRYNKDLNSKEKIILLNPLNINNAYVFNTGWASSDKNIDLPNTETKWKVSQNKKLTPNNPITLFYENSQGLRIERTISLDKHVFIHT